jgi:hypothetical protein
VSAFLGRVAPELLDELRGLSDGAQMPFEQTLLMSTYNSLFVSLANSTPLVDQLQLPDGCSAVGIRGGPGGPFVFKTNDGPGPRDARTPEQRRAFAERMDRSTYVVRANYRPGPSVLGIRYAGSIWTECGVNSFGLAFGATSLHPRLSPQTAAGLPQHFIGTFALNRCRSVAEAKRALPAVPVFGKGYAGALSDRNGEVIGFEKTARHTGFNEPQSGVAFQTNHIRSTEMARLGREQDPAFWAGSYFRNTDNRARLISRAAASWNGATAWDDLLGDLFRIGGEGDLVQNCAEQCQHWITSWAALVFSRTKEMWVTEGLPEERKFQKWKLF